LKHYKILAIIESKVERWFVDADVNTCIVILERSDKKGERNDNVVRFVQLKKPLRHFIPNAEKNWDKEVKRLQEIGKLVDLILAHTDYYENEEIRIYPKTQVDLWIEGYDEDSQKYTGAKWGKYIRAPEIFFKVMENGKDLFVPLKEVAEVRRGFTTGANEFFYLTEEEIKIWGIEEEFWCHKEGGNWVPNYVIKSLKESKTIQVTSNDLKYRVLMIHKDKRELEGTNVLKYIEYGENEKIGKGDKASIPAQRPTCASRERWYDLGTRTPGPILYVERMGDRFVVLYNKSKVFVNKNLYEIFPKEDTSLPLLCGILNSTITDLSNELYGRILTGAQNVIDIDVWMTNQIPVIHPDKITKNQIRKLNNAFENLSRRPIEHILKELGAETLEEVSLDKVKPDRRELDKVVFEILGLTEDSPLRNATHNPEF